ncbi:MAG TPA: MBL fold metallo-hydrolase [Baekduia sp.]|uniref:MBL fold metallo-hydrolase n=1 Tax=Baekduia sp. TaxID=2600305 RepID=UPI002D784EE6|nr:MBL fold metallo-hydrolase [Baekduia sp.]HET6506980.1 MBL fold metallo-hydrolase [Baekduia sp.]
MTGVPPANWAVDVAATTTHPIADGVWALRLPSPWHHISHANAYVIEDAEGIALIDTGSGGHPTALDALERALEAVEWRLSDVHDLLITHYHTDHMGLAGTVHAASGCTIWGHPRHDVFFEVLERPDEVHARRLAHARREGAGGTVLEACASTREEHEGAVPQPRPHRALAAGTRVPTGIGELVVVETTGHCPSQVALWEPARRMVFSADLLMRDFVSFCDVVEGEDVLGAFRASVERVAALDAAVALPGHGRPITDVPALIGRYREGLAARMALVEATLDDEPRSTMDVARRVFAADVPASAVWHFLETCCYLEHLATLGRAVRDEALPGWRRAGAAAGR